MSIPFQVPAQFLAGLSSGDLVRYGTILKDVGTGRIVGHVQETGILQQVIQTGLSIDPTGATGLIGVAHNAAISSKLNAMQAMMGTLQTLQLATLASGVVGIGVTAATAAMIMSRLQAIDKTLVGVAENVEALPSKWRELELQKKLSNVATAVDRMQEAEVRPDSEIVLKSVDEKLNYTFDELHNGICNIVVEAKVDADLLRSLLAGLALCGGAQIKSLIWLDMKEAAERRAQNQVEKLQQLALLMPRDVMHARLIQGEDEALRLSHECSEMRLRVASQPDLARALVAQNIHGREFIERIQEEEKAPLLLLPSS